MMRAKDVQLANPRGATNAGRHTMRATGVELANPRGATNVGRHMMRAREVELANPRGCNRRVGDKELAILMDARGPAIAKGRDKRWATQSMRGNHGTCDSYGCQRPRAEGIKRAPPMDALILRFQTA